MICSIRYGRENVALFALVSALLFLTLLGGCSNGSSHNESRITQLETYDEVRTKGDIEHIRGIPFIMPSGWEMEITNFTSGQAIDRKIKLPKLPKFSEGVATIFKLYFPPGNEEEFQNIGGTIALTLEAKGQSWGAIATLDTLTICSANYMYIDEFTDVDFPHYPDFVPEYAHIVYKPNKSSIDMPIKVVLRSGGGK